MIKLCATLMFLAVLAGCGGRDRRMENPEDPAGRYRAQIGAAKRMLAQQADWAERAEWEVARTGSGWKITAWRVQYPDRQGPARYVPWGYAVIELDRELAVVSYGRRNRAHLPP